MSGVCRHTEHPNLSGVVVAVHHLVLVAVEQVHHRLHVYRIVTNRLIVALRAEVKNGEMISEFQTVRHNTAFTTFLAQTAFTTFLV